PSSSSSRSPLSPICGDPLVGIVPSPLLAAASWEKSLRVSERLRVASLPALGVSEGTRVLLLLLLLPLACLLLPLLVVPSAAADGGAGGDANPVDKASSLATLTIGVPEETRLLLLLLSPFVCLALPLLAVLSPATDDGGGDANPIGSAVSLATPSGRPILPPFRPPTPPLLPPPLLEPLRPVCAASSSRLPSSGTT
ncbi:unnamed protein product, partial [Ectocarpus sp. 4 AP-2014]